MKFENLIAKFIHNSYLVINAQLATIFFIPSLLHFSYVQFGNCSFGYVIPAFGDRPPNPYQPLKDFNSEAFITQGTTIAYIGACGKLPKF